MPGASRLPARSAPPSSGTTSSSTGRQRPRSSGRCSFRRCRLFAANTGVVRDVRRRLRGASDWRHCHGAFRRPRRTQVHARVVADADGGSRRSASGFYPGTNRIGAVGARAAHRLPASAGLCPGRRVGRRRPDVVEHAPAGRRASTAASSPSACRSASSCRMRCSWRRHSFVDPIAFVAWGWRSAVPGQRHPRWRGAVHPRRPLTRARHSPICIQRGAMRRMPAVDVLRTKRPVRFCSLRVATPASARSATSCLVYYVSYATRARPFRCRWCSTPLLIAAGTLGVSVVVFARWSDRRPPSDYGAGQRRSGGRGRRSFFRCSIRARCRSSPSLLCVMLIAQGAYIGTQPAVFSELFAPSVRYSGASLSNTLGTILGGAPAPFVAAALVLG